MKIPNSIDVFGMKVSIKLSKNISDDFGNALDGQWDSKSKTITLNAELKGVDLAQTFFHEIIHAIIHRTGVKQTYLSHDCEEIISENVSVWLGENFDFKLKRRTRNKH